MVRRVALIALVLLLAVGIIPAMAGDEGTCKGKNVLQSMYDWFSGCDKPCQK